MGLDLNLDSAYVLVFWPKLYTQILDWGDSSGTGKLTQ